GPLPARPAVRTRDLGQAVLRGAALLLLELLLEVVRPEASVAGGALGQRVGEHLDVPRRLPHLPWQDDGGVQTDDVVTRGHHGPPPLALDVLLELDPQRPVVPRGSGAAVDLPAGEDEAAALGQRDDGVETGRVGHEGPPGAAENASARGS